MATVLFRALGRYRIVHNSTARLSQEGRSNVEYTVLRSQPEPVQAWGGSTEPHPLLISAPAVPLFVLYTDRGSLHGDNFATFVHVVGHNNYIG